MALFVLKKRAFKESLLMDDAKCGTDELSKEQVDILEKIRNRMKGRGVHYNGKRCKSIRNVTPIKVEQIKRKPEKEAIQVNKRNVTTTKVKQLKRKPEKEAIQVNKRKRTSPTSTVLGKENNRRSAGSESPVGGYVNSSPCGNVCTRCNECFQWKSALRKHEMFCSEPFKCDYCGFVTSDREGLDRHWRKDHSSIQLENCDYCNTKYDQSSMFWFHSSGYCVKQQSTPQRYVRRDMFTGKL